MSPQRKIPENSKQKSSINFNHFSHAGIPTVILGPDGANLHAGEERVNLKQLDILVEILVDFLMNQASSIP